MKYCLLIVVFLGLYIKLYNQNTFELLIDKDYSQRNTSVVIDDEGNYIVSIIEYEISDYNSMILKITPEGEVINSRYFNSQYKESILDIIRVESNEFIIFGSIVDELNNSFLWIMKINSNLDILWNKKWEINSQIKRLNSKLNSKNQIILYGGVSRSTYFSSFIYKIDTSGNIIDSTYLYNYNIFACVFDILEKKDSSGYYLFQYSNYEKIIEIDTNFIILSTRQDLPSAGDFYVFDNSNNSFWISDSSFVFSGKIYNTKTNEEDLVLLISDSNFNTINFFVSENIGNDMVAFWDNISFIDKKNIFLVGTNNYLPAPYDPSPSWIIVDNLNDTLGLKWQKLIGGEVNINATNVIATEDGGCFIAATKVDTNNTYDFDMYFLKLDSLGNVPIGIEEETEIKVTDYAVYPNPATDYIKVFKAIQVHESDFQLYNTSGQMILYKHLTDNITEINISSLPAGMYLFNILKDGKQMETGKLVIKN